LECISEFKKSVGLLSNKKEEKIRKEKMDEDIDGYYLDDGTKIDPNLIPKPGLCLTCKKDDDPAEEILCTLTRIDERDDSEFVCYSYEPKSKQGFA